MSVADRWHLSRPPAGAKKCSAHRKVPSAEHGIGLRWQVRGTDDRGLPVKRNFEYEDDAKNHDAGLKASVKAGTYVDDRAGRVTFREYAEEWRRTRRKQGYATAERVERSLRNHVYPVLGDVPMSLLGRRVSLVQQWISGLDLNPNSARLLIGTVSAVFKAAVDDRIIARNPLKAESVDKPSRQRPEVTAWSEEQVAAVCDALPGELTAMAWLGAVTGMRQGELFGLAVDKADFFRRNITVDTQVIQVGGGLAFGPLKNHRTRKSRTVPLARAVIPVLARHAEVYRPAEVTLPWSQKRSPLDGKPVTRTLLFTDGRNHAWYRQAVNRRWRTAWGAAGVPDLGRANGMHVLRHTAASRWLSRGLNPAKVADYLGDTVTVVLETYAHFVPEDDDLGRAIMDDFAVPDTSERPPGALLAGN